MAGRSGGRTDEMTGDRRVGSLAPTRDNPGVSAQVAPARAWPPLCRAAMYSPTRQMRSSIILLRAPDDSAGHYSRLSAASGSLGCHTPGGHDRPAGSALGGSEWAAVFSRWPAAGATARSWWRVGGELAEWGCDQCEDRHSGWSRHRGRTKQGKHFSCSAVLRRARVVVLRCSQCYGMVIRCIC